MNEHFGFDDFSLMPTLIAVFWSFSLQFGV